MEPTRRIAIDHHHLEAVTFVRYYEQMERSRFSNAFTYGRHKVDVLLDEALSSVPTGSRVLDLGCGTGHYLQRYREAPFEMVGVEPAEAMRAHARKLNPESVIEDGLVTRIPFEEGSFALVFAIEVYRYLTREDFEASLREVHRVLEPGGRFFFTMVNRWALDGFSVLYHGRRLVRGVDKDEKHPHCEFYTPDEIRDACLSGGFGDVEINDRLFGPIRWLYRVNERVGATVAEQIEKVDDLVSGSRWMKGLGGHSVVRARKPMSA